MVRYASSVVLALVLGLTGAVKADATDQTDLRSEITALKALVKQQGQELSTLKAQTGESWLNERRAEEVKALVQEVLSDADTRATLLNDGLTAGHNGEHFYLSSADGTFLMTISGLVQARYVYNRRNGTDPTAAAIIPGTGAGTLSADEKESGFEMARTKLAFAGHIADPRIGYYVSLEAYKDTGAVHLEQAYLTYCPTDDLVFWVGQAKAPGLREELTDDSRALAVDRSLTNEMFTLGLVQGVGAIWSPAMLNDMAKIHLSFNDGGRSGEAGGAGYRGYDMDYSEDSTDYALSGRIDVKLAGDWNQWDDFSAWSGEPMAVFVGAAAHYEASETGDSQASPVGALGIDDIFLWTVDSSVEWNGFNLFGAIIGQHLEHTAGLWSSNTDQFALVVQGGYMVIPDKLEPFARYEWIQTEWNSTSGVAGAGGFIPGAAGADEDVHIFTIGANYYLNRHNAKFTTDIVWVASPLDAQNSGGVFLPGYTGVSNATSLLPDSFNSENQIMLRAQLQVAF